MHSRIDVYLWVIDQCYAKPWDPCISTGSYCPKVYLWLSEAYWRELPCAHGSERLRSAVPEISADQCPALINWYLDEYWSLWHILGIFRKVFLRAFRRILDRGNRASIHGVMAEWSLWHYTCLTFVSTGHSRTSESFSSSIYTLFSEIIMSKYLILLCSKKHFSALA